jgi:hypothetical protein
LHFGAGVGPAWFSYSERKNDVYEIVTAGAGGAAWAGYHAWVGRQRSLGANLRLLGARTWETANDPDRAVTAFGGALLFSALYH